MAITVYSSPNVVTNIGVPVIFRVESDSTDITTVIQAKIYYSRRMCDFFTLASIQVQGKAVGHNYYEFNISSALAKVLSSDYQTGSTRLLTDVGNSCIEWVIKLTEYYPSSLFVAHGTLTYATGFYFSNTELYKTETQSVYTGSDWYMDGAASHKFLTDSPSTQYLRASERIQLDLLTSYTDPIIKVRETKNNLSTATVSYELPDTTYVSYLWDWAINAIQTVSINPRITGNEGTVWALSSGSAYLYMADTNGIMWGGVNLIANNDVLDCYLPYITVASATISIRHAAKLGIIFNWEIYYYISGVWTASLINPSNTSTLNVFATLTETMPAGATAIRIKKITAGTDQLWIPYMYVSYVSDDVENKRCQFTLDTTHIDSDTKMLEVWAESTVSSNTVISEVKTFLVDKTPTAQDTTRFAVRNKRGGFDHFTYTQMHSEILTAEKTRSTKELPNTFTTKDRGTGVTQVNSEKIFTCYSNYIEAAELQWWATIIESKEVYVIVSDVQYAVDIITSSVVTYTHTDLVQLKMDWTYAYKR